MHVRAYAGKGHALECVHVCAYTQTHTRLRVCACVRIHTHTHTNTQGSEEDSEPVSTEDKFVGAENRLIRILDMCRMAY